MLIYRALILAGLATFLAVPLLHAESFDTATSGPVALESSPPTLESALTLGPVLGLAVAGAALRRRRATGLIA